MLQYYHYRSQRLYSNLDQLRSIVPDIMDQGQLAQKRIPADFLCNDKLLRNQSTLCYHYPSQILYANPGQ